MTTRSPFHKTYSLFVRNRTDIRWERISVTALTLNKARHHFQSILINLSMKPGIECRLRPAAEVTDPESIQLIKEYRTTLFTRLGF